MKIEQLPAINAVAFTNPHGDAIRTGLAAVAGTSYFLEARFGPVSRSPTIRPQKGLGFREGCLVITTHYGSHFCTVVERSMRTTRW